MTRCSNCNGPLDVVELVQPGEKRKIIVDKALEWGELTVPEKGAHSEKNRNGLRVLFFGSAGFGLSVLESLKKLEEKYPDRINLRALVTDMPTCSTAKISSEKRVWRFFSTQERQKLFDDIKASALSFGIPCYSGAIKCDFFRQLLHAWEPEIIVMCCFGQLVDDAIFKYPVYGMYNFHPSDLAASIGIGTQPVEHTIQMGLTTTRLTLHQVNEVIDGGSVIGKSPLINITLPDGAYPENILPLYCKVCSPAAWMTMELIHAVLEKKSAGEKGSVDSLDFEKCMPDDIRKLLMEPVACGLDAYTLPLHGSLT